MSTAARRAMSPNFPRFSIRLPGLIGIVAAAIVVVFGCMGSIAQVAAEETALDRIAAHRARRNARMLADLEQHHRLLLTQASERNEVAERRYRRPDEVFEGMFGDTGPETLAATQRSLETALRQKLETISWVCGLTESQKAKLELAGHGDIKRFLERVDT